MTEGMGHREQVIEHLTGDVGLTREEALAHMADDDLWILAPEQRHVFEPDEAVEQWRFAADFARSLSRGFSESTAINDATRQLLWDLEDRSQEALRRARERAGDEEE